MENEQKPTVTTTTTTSEEEELHRPDRNVVRLGKRSQYFKEAEASGGHIISSLRAPGSPDFKRHRVSEVDPQEDVETQSPPHDLESGSEVSEESGSEGEIEPIFTIDHMPRPIQWAQGIKSDDSEEVLGNKISEHLSQLLRDEYKEELERWSRICKTSIRGRLPVFKVSVNWERPLAAKPSSGNL